jgi:ankyrin repeat protein
MQILVEAGADVNTSCPGLNGAGTDTPLMYAERSGYIRLAEYVVLHGAITHAQQATSSEFVSVPLVAAANFGDVAHMKFLLAHGAKRDARTYSGRTALIAACFQQTTNVRVHIGLSRSTLDSREARQCAVLQMLLNIGSNVDAVDARGRTALIEAAWSPKLSAILLAHGASINQADADGYTPLTAAMNAGSLATVRVLLAHGADVNESDNEDGSALGMAMYGELSPEEKAPFVSELKKYGARLSLAEAAREGNADEFDAAVPYATNTGNARDGSPLLSLAVHGGSMHIVKALLDRHVPVDGVNSRGWTPLMMAAGEGKQEIVKCLLDHGASTDLKTITGATVRHIAERHHRKEILDLLDRAGRPVAMQ